MTDFDELMRKRNETADMLTGDWTEPVVIGRMDRSEYEKLVNLLKDAPEPVIDQSYQRYVAEGKGRLSKGEKKRRKKEGRWN